MQPSNDNAPDAGASRDLPIVGVVRLDGRVQFAPKPPRVAGQDAHVPNDPREA